MKGAYTVISVSMDDRVLAAIEKYAEGAAFTRSMLITYACAQLVGVPFEPRKLKEKDEDRD